MYLWQAMPLEMSQRPPLWHPCPSPLSWWSWWSGCILTKTGPFNFGLGLKLGCLKLFCLFFKLNLRMSCGLVAKSCLTLCHPWSAACQASLSSTVSWSLLKLISIVLMMLSNHLTLCRPFSCPKSLPASVPMSQLFTSHSQNIGASASVLPMNIQGWFL